MLAFIFDEEQPKTMNKLRLKITAFALILASAGFISKPATAATLNPNLIGSFIYIYSRANLCDLRVPRQFTTIQAAINAAHAGNTICVGPGTYNENIRIDKSIRLSGIGAYATTINGQGTDPNVPTVYIAGDGNANNVILEGFRIKGIDSSVVSQNASALNIGPFVSGTIIRDDWISAGNSTLVVRADSGQNNTLIYNNIFEGHNSPEIFLVSGVQGPAGKVDFVSNTFTGSVISIPNSDTGRVLDTWATNSLIQRNIFKATGSITALISSAYPSNSINMNNFRSNNSLKVGTYSGGTLNAENNWWGDNDLSDNIHGDVDFTPFATKPFLEWPSP